MDGGRTCRTDDRTFQHSILRTITKKGCPSCHVYLTFRRFKIGAGTLELGDSMEQGQNKNKKFDEIQSICVTPPLIQKTNMIITSVDESASAQCSAVESILMV